jgi:hypothetical protein
MDKILSRIRNTLGLAPKGSPVTLDYNKSIILDAEDLAEEGIAAAYERVMQALSHYIPSPENLEEVIDQNGGRYHIRFRGKEYNIASPELPFENGEAWGRATYIFFHLVNEQLKDTPVRLYALYGGNDLSGIVLAPDIAERARLALPRKFDWPYIPQSNPLWWGGHH